MFVIRGKLLFSAWTHSSNSWLSGTRDDVILWIRSWAFPRFQGKVKIILITSGFIWTGPLRDTDRVQRTVGWNRAKPLPHQVSHQSILTSPHVSWLLWTSFPQEGSVSSFNLGPSEANPTKITLRVLQANQLDIWWSNSTHQLKASKTSVKLRNWQKTWVLETDGSEVSGQVAAPPEHQSSVCWCWT